MNSFFHKSVLNVSFDHDFTRIPRLMMLAKSAHGQQSCCHSPILGLLFQIHESHCTVDAESLLGREPGVSGYQGANIGLASSYLAC